MKAALFCALTIIAAFVGPSLAQGNVTEDHFDEEANSTAITFPDFLVCLSKYGEIDFVNIKIEQLSNALKVFQANHKIPQTGKFDNETCLQMIEEKRREEETKQNQIPFPEYVLNHKKYQTSFTYQIQRFSTNTNLTVAQQRDAIRRAFDEYSKVSPLVFTETTEIPDITILFVDEKIHYHNTKFGSDGVVAHAGSDFFHFSDAETWTLDESKPINTTRNLFYVAMHEIGHVVGLADSKDMDAVMYGSNTQYRPELAPDDIAGLQVHYGKPKPKTPKRTTPRTITPPRPTNANALPKGGSFCGINYRTINAAMKTDSNIFLFVDDYFVIDDFLNQKLAIRDWFRYGPPRVQAAVFSNQGKTAYLFYDKYVYAYSLDSYGKFHLVDGLPRFLPDSQTHNLDYAIKLVEFDREMIYLVKNGLFQYFFPGAKTVSHTPVYEIGLLFQYLPENIDSTISTDQEIFFISGQTAYRASKTTRIVREGYPVELALRLCQYQN